MEQASNLQPKFQLPGGLIAVIFFFTAFPLVMSVFGVGAGWGYPKEVFQPATKNLLAIDPIEPLIFHAVLDWLALLGIATMAFLALLRFRLRREVFAPLIGLCFSGGGVLWSLHLLVSHNALPGASFTRSALFSTWLGSRLFFPLTITLGLFMLERAQPLRKSHYPAFLKQVGTVVAVLAGIGLVLFWALAGVERLVNFALPLNFLVAMFYLSAALFVNSVGRKLYAGYFTEALLLSFIPFTAAQFLLLFTPGTVLNNLELYAHFLMTFGFFIPFGGLTIDYIHTYHRKAQAARQMRQLQEQLLERSNQLEQTNRILQEQIEQRREAQARLHASEERARTIIETATDAFIGIDQKGLITEWNHQAEITFGWSKEEILGKSIYEKLLLSPFSKAFAEEIQTYLETHESQFIFNRVELTARHRSGHPFVVELTMWPIRMAEGYQFFAFVRDVSERKRIMENQARLVRELERTNKELQDFAYIVSHDLKAPLRSIASLANWIYSDYINVLDEQGKQHLNLLISRVKRMHNLIEGVLQYAKAGMRKAQKAFVNLDALVNDVVDLLVPTDRFEVSIPEPLPTILADNTHLQHIFQNLISNAVKFMDKKQGKIQITCCETTHQWTFCVLDNGPGIEPEQQEKIFQIFQTVHTRDHHENTGIGLALVKKIIELNNGKIWVESTPGKGSAFYFTLPKSEVYRDEVVDLMDRN